ncbi:hypothetical protein EP073_00525 [Geovibrio thiophilus]|uniref:Uncharacterized protein n=1 Tax=Geovibrio thiophilus TaxID=139438 RepID=A0A3R5XV66_9BACT|nr:hypothetical protein [Geovibrio thiophilus]QAR31936.1 hypothetical protein EP073_00525 [Geovibrio thiophilus]
MRSLFLYFARNPLFALAFIFSRLPFWALLISFSFGYIDAPGTVFTAVLVFFSRGYVEQEISFGHPVSRFFSTALIKPLLIITGIFLFVAAYPFLLYFLASEDIYIQTGFIILLILAAYLLLFAGRETFGLNTFGVRGLRKPSGSLSVRLLITFFWVYILAGNDHLWLIIPALLTVFILEVYQFTKKYEGII